MRYKKFTISNFKGIKNLTIDLDKEPKSKVFTLVGLNESGKTSILEAINLLSAIVPLNKRHELIPKSEKINFNQMISVKGFLEVSTDDLEKIQNTIRGFGYKDIESFTSITISANYFFKDSVPQAYGGISYDIPLVAKKKKSKRTSKLISTEEPYKNVISLIREKLEPSILYYPNFLFDFPNKIYIGKGDGTVEDSEYTDVVQDILYSIKADLTISKHLLNRLINTSESNKEALESTLNKMSEKVSTTVFKAWSKLFNVGKKEIVITAGQEIVQGETAFYLEFKLKEGSDKYHISERSLGFKWFFTFLLFTEFRKNRVTESSELLFLLDEPASNLHSTAQKNLLKTFDDIVQKSTLIYTTHSHHLINPEWLNGAYIVRNKAMNYDDEINYDSTKTDIEVSLYKQFVASHPNQKDYYQPILDSLDYQPGLLEKISSIVITEGKNDYYTLKYFKELFSSPKFKKLNFYPGGGANTNFQIIRLYLAWGRDFIIFLDADKHGAKSRKAYEREFGIEVRNKIFTYEDVNKDLEGKSTEDVFTEDERLSITKFFDPNAESFDKSKFNTSIQNLLFQKHKLRLSENTINYFQSVLEFAESKLALSSK